MTNDFSWKGLGASLGLYPLTLEAAVEAMNNDGWHAQDNIQAGEMFDGLAQEAQQSGRDAGVDAQAQEALDAARARASEALQDVKDAARDAQAARGLKDVPAYNEARDRIDAAIDRIDEASADAVDAVNEGLRRKQSAGAKKSEKAQSESLGSGVVERVMESAGVALVAGAGSYFLVKGVRTLAATAVFGPPGFVASALAP